jgi:1-acyl-sn-glycerol-3-phosphate acyltransferase
MFKTLQHELACLFALCNYNPCFARIPAWCIVQVGKVIGVSLEIQGVENINKDHGGVVLINHQSAIDLMGEFAAASKQV